MIHWVNPVLLKARRVEKVLVDIEDVSLLEVVVSLMECGVSEDELLQSDSESRAVMKLAVRLTYEP